MNDLLQKHGCANVFTVPEGLKELMADISREVLRDQPPKIFDYIANYLSVLLITREHGILAVRILDDLCDCRPSVCEHLLGIGLERNQATSLAEIIRDEIQNFEPEEGKEKLKETQIMKRILAKAVLDEDTSAKVCQIIRNAYRDFWYRKKLLERKIKVHPEEPWEIAAERTLMIYRSTKPSYSELNRATEKIQAAYRGYHIRRNMLRHLRPRSKKKQGPKVELPGAPIDAAHSREIDLGPVLDIKPREENVQGLFEDAVADKLGLPYDPMKTLTHVETAKESNMPPGEVTGDAKAARIHSSPQLTTKSVAPILDASKTLSTKSMPSKPMTGNSMMTKPSRMDREFDKPVDNIADEDLPKRSQTAVVASGRSNIYSEGSQQKISFSNIPAEVIEDEVPEEIAQNAEGADEIPEDITVAGEMSEGESAAVSSVPDADTSAPEDTGESASEAENEE